MSQIYKCIRDPYGPLLSHYVGAIDFKPNKNTLFEHKSAKL